MSTPENPEGAESAAAANSDSTNGTQLTGLSTRKPTPAASAASRARRIGGATATRPILSPPDEPAAEPVTGGKGRGRWSVKKRATAAAPVAAGTHHASTNGTGVVDTNTTTSSVTTSAGVGDDAKRGGLSLLKRHPRTTSARELKEQADGGPAVITEAPQWLRWVPAIVLSACAIAMIVIIAVSAHGVWYAKPSTADARDKVLAAAKTCTSTANTYNYKTLAADEKRGLACTTGGWTAQYKSALDKIVKPTATKLKASQTVQINAAGVESVSSDARQWTTIVYGQLTINQSGATPRVDPFAAIVRMDKVKSSYLVSKIDLITNPSS